MATRLLGLLESQLGFGVRKALNAGVWLLLYQAAVALSLAGLSVAFAHLLPRSTYGEYSFILSAAAVIATFSLTGFGPAVAQSTARGFDGSLYAAVRENLRWSILVLAGATAAAAYFALNHNTPYAVCFIIIAVATPLYQTSALADNYLLGKKRFKVRSVQKGLLALLSAACLFIALLLHASLVALVATYFVSRATIEIVCYLWTTVRYQPSNLSVEEGFITHGLSLSGFSVLTSFADQADALFLFALLGPTALAVYSFATAPPELMKGALKNYVAWLGLPVFASLTPHEARRHLVSRILVAAALTIVAVGIYVVVAPYFFALLFPQYLDAVWYSQVFALSLVLVTMANFPITALSAMASTKRAYYRFLAVAEIIQIGLLFIGVRYFGILGAIGAYFVMRAFRLGYSLLLLYTA